MDASLNKRISRHVEKSLMYALEDYAVRTKSSPTIVWIPDHLGIQGNETPDDLCKRALHHDAVDIPTTLEYREARTIYRDFFLRKWQAEWATSDTGSHHRALEPTISLARKFGDPNRRTEVAINRLRLGHSCLNHQLHLWGRHASGNCDGCGVPETIRHFLLECPAQVGLQDDTARTCARNNWPFDLRPTLCQPAAWTSCTSGCLFLEYVCETAYNQDQDQELYITSDLPCYEH